MRKGRLIRLAKYLETTAQRLELAARRKGFRKFYMGAFALSPFTFAETKAAKRNACGFAGCAVGWAAHAKIVPGLRLSSAQGEPVYVRGKRHYRSWDAVERAFGVGTDQAYSLFSGLGRADEMPRETAARIRAFVKGADPWTL